MKALLTNHSVVSLQRWQQQPKNSSQLCRAFTSCRLLHFSLDKNVENVCLKLTRNHVAISCEKSNEIQAKTGECVCVTYEYIHDGRTKIGRKFFISRLNFKFMQKVYCTDNGLVHILHAHFNSSSNWFLYWVCRSAEQKKIRIQSKDNIFQWHFLQFFVASVAAAVSQEIEQNFIAQN